MAPKRRSKIDPKTRPGETLNTLKKKNSFLEPSWSHLGGKVEVMLEQSWRRSGSHLGSEVEAFLESILA